MEYKSNGKGIMTPMEDILMVYSPNGKDVLWKIVFRSAIVKIKDKKMQHKRYNVNQNKFFLHYMKRTREMLPVVFKEFEEIYIIFATFFFSLIVNWLKVKRQKSCGRTEAPQFPRFLRVCYFNFINCVMCHIS